MYGSDQAASLEKSGLKNLIEIVRKIPIVIGEKDKQLFEVEKEVAKNLDTGAKFFEKRILFH